MGFPFLLDAPPSKLDSSVLLCTDASDLGFGGHFGPCWFSYPWMQGEKDKFPIFYRELYAIIAAMSTFGNQWKGKIIHFYTDSANAIVAAKKMTSRNAAMMHLLRHLHTLCVDFGCHIWFDYINTKANGPADSLSKLNLQKFRRQMPHALSTPSPLLRSLPSHPW